MIRRALSTTRQSVRADRLRPRARTVWSAGISTESGVSDYRSKGGLWDRFQPVTIQEFLASEEKRREYWRRKKAMFGEMCCTPEAEQRSSSSAQSATMIRFALSFPTTAIIFLPRFARNCSSHFLRHVPRGRGWACLLCVALPRRMGEKLWSSRVFTVRPSQFVCRLIAQQPGCPVAS